MSFTARDEKLPRRSTPLIARWLSLRHQRALRRAAAIAPSASSPSRRRKALGVLGLWLVAVALGGFFDASDSLGLDFGFDWFEGYAYKTASAVRANLKPSTQAGNQTAATDIVIVALSDETFSPDSFSPLPGPPVPRDYHAKLIQTLSSAGAKIIAFDLIFDALRPQDEILVDSTIAAAKKGTQVIWGCFVDDSNQLVLPNVELRKASPNTAHLLMEKNPNRPLMERIPAFIIGEPDLGTPDKIPALSLRIAMLAKGINHQDPRRVAGSWQLGNFRVPIESDGTFAISYASSRINAFPVVPFENLMNPGEEADFYRKLFQDKIVLVGDTTKIGNDIKDTPLGFMPGVEVHAHAVNTLLRSEFLRAAPMWLNLSMVALLPVLLALFHDTRRIRTLILAIAALALGYALLALWLFVAHSFSLHMVGPLVAFFLFSTLLLIERSWREERARAQMFDALVLAASSAIETRDPSTAGHSRRVTCMTIELAVAVSAAREGKYKRVRYSNLQIKELCYAALLHDFGKIGVREAVLTKSHKLEPLHFQAVKSRLLLLRSTRQLELLNQKIEVLQSDCSTVEKQNRLDLSEQNFAQELANLNEKLNLLERANDPQAMWMPDAEYSALQKTLNELEQQIYLDENGASQPLITAEEKAALSIRKGSLTAAEFGQIQSHAQMSYDFLKRIHWTRDLENLAHIAWGHHEKLSGKGYPRGVSGDEIPLSTRMMTIADIYDALTASDRPYKKAMPVERALGILKSEVEDGGIDGDLLEIFIEEKVYDSTCDGRAAWLLT